MKFLNNIISGLYTGDNKLRILDQRYLPRWIVFIIDFLLCTLSLVLVYFILLETSILFSDAISMSGQAVLILGVNLVFFIVFKTYSGIIRHSTFIDILKLALSASATAASLIVANYIYFLFTGHKIYAFALLLMYLFLSFSILLLFRVFIKEFYQIIKKGARNVLNKRVAIIGTNDTTISLGQALLTEANLPFKLVGFLTENLVTKNIKLLGKPVIPVKNNFAEIIVKYRIEGVILIGDSVTVKEKKAIVDLCLESNIEIFNVPHLEKLNSNTDFRNKIRPIQIEDLLERELIAIENKAIEEDLKDKVILVTGGAGSIGSEIVRQIAQHSPKLVVILDQAESALHELELDLLLKFPGLRFISELANISNMYRLEQLFSKYQFDLVYHAAAYKHVPLIERNPHEAIFVNILGTVNLSVLAVNHNIARFVMVSTDKAVNPTNVMGASKRVAEMYVQSLQKKEDTHTRFITTRFGNVLGSNGSVIPYFRKQIAAGGPVTVTHRDIIRYFMTIPEACQLVLQAASMGTGGEIFVFDMGKPIRILDMAERMIRLSGLTPYKDIDIEISGLRPGEKLYEELLNDTSTTLPTPHPKIMISEVPTVPFDEINLKIKKMIEVATKHKDLKVVSLLKDLVPEYKSENSIFKKLDTNVDEK